MASACLTTPKAQLAMIRTSAARMASSAAVDMMGSPVLWAVPALSKPSGSSRQLLTTPSVAKFVLGKAAGGYLSR